MAVQTSIIGNDSAGNNGGTVGSDVFHAVCPEVI
jgi:hypothetical protein